ncbi:EAL domain-containing protein [Actinotalea sp. M2MS4P-6]|uniref:EAL domain-containing protein n=1 Tax=Actinotalea sp. M2MS4P-6 TaxID=2983762 RepID=UPI0021E38E06|nr:EAL domain-containing protein [Actinotalea sp. M2MS4P-6]MCV2395204.1 EAL domain-containing protein [Actinotalea sp. M2MS4P-6]
MPSRPAGLPVPPPAIARAAAAARAARRSAGTATADPAAGAREPLGNGPSGEHPTPAALVDALLRPGAIGMALQPMVRLVDGAVVAYEALARTDVTTGSPEEWLEVAASAGRRNDVELACLEAAAKLGTPPEGAPIAVNISPSVVLDPRLPDVLAGLPRHALEITEHQAVEDYDTLRGTLDRLRSTGTLVAVDDVGAGYASMAHVLALAPTFVKIDRSLVDGIHADPGRRAVVQALHAFTSAIGGLSVAEGVEDIADLRALRALGVDLVQGFGVARPEGPWPTLDPAARRVLRPGADDLLPAGTEHSATLEIALATATSQAQACEAVAAHIATVGGLLPTVYLERGGVLRCQARRGQWLALDGLHPGVGITGLAYAEEREVVVDDVTTEPRYRAAVPGIRAEIAVPIRSDGRVVGVCNVDTVVPLSSTARALVRRCVAQLEDRLDQLTIGPETSGALHALSRFTPAVMAAGTIDSVASTALAGVRDLVDFTSGCLWRMSDSTVTAAVGPQGRALAMLPPARVSELAALLTGVSSCVAGGSGTSLAFAATDSLRDLGVRGVLLIPVRDGRQLTDLLVVISPTRSAVGPDLVVAAEQLCLLAGSRLAALRDHTRTMHRRTRPGTVAVPERTAAAPVPTAGTASGEVHDTAPRPRDDADGGPEVPGPRTEPPAPVAPRSSTPLPVARRARTVAGHPARTPGAGPTEHSNTYQQHHEVPTVAALPAVLSALEASCTELTVLPDRGALDALSVEVIVDVLRGHPARGVDRARALRPVVEAVGDQVTARRLRRTEAMGLLELGRFAEALEVAQALAFDVIGASRAWRSTALALVAEASSLLGATTESIDALSEADWLLRQVRPGSAGHLSAALGVVRAARAAHLYERADAVLRSIGRIPTPDVELVVAHERALLAMQWMTMLQLVDRQDEAARLAPRVVTHALQVQAIAQRLGDGQSRARGQVLEAAGWHAQGEVELAGGVARTAAATYERRPELVETGVLELVLGAAARHHGSADDAAGHLAEAVRVSGTSGRAVWATAARTALADLESTRDVANAAALWRAVAASSMALAWAERDARFAAIGGHDSIRVLNANVERHGRASEEDPLTGLGNRRLLRRVAQGMAPEAVVFVDIDRFKSVNDRYSHAVGDHVLQVLSRILRATSRVGDLLVRYGGDEFVVVPHGGADAARRLAHRVRAAVEGFDWGTLAPGLELTVSVGLGTGGADSDGVLAADEAMLRAKRAGRNQVVEAGAPARSADEPA